MVCEKCGSEIDDTFKNMLIRLDAKFDSLIVRLNGFPEKVIELENEVHNIVKSCDTCKTGLEVYKNEHKKDHESISSNTKWGFQTLLSIAAIVVSIVAIALRF